MISQQDTNVEPHLTRGSKSAAKGILPLASDAIGVGRGYEKFTNVTVARFPLARSTVINPVDSRLLSAWCLSGAGRKAESFLGHFEGERLLHPSEKAQHSLVLLRPSPQTSNSGR